MYGIEILMEEHQNILKFLDLLEVKFIGLIEGMDPDIEFFRISIDFIREYADKHHHKKEEDYLFIKMLEELGTTAEKLIKVGMLIEHDLARYTVMEFEKSLNLYEENPNSKNKLDIIGHGMNYIYLLRRHIDKEDKVLYPFGEKNLSRSSISWIDEKTKEEEINTKFLKKKFKDIFDLI